MEDLEELALEDLDVSGAYLYHAAKRYCAVIEAAWIQQAQPFRPCVKHGTDEEFISVGSAGVDLTQAAARWADAHNRVFPDDEDEDED